MVKITKPFRMRLGKHARVFVTPGNFFQRLFLRWRGYRPHIVGPLWSRPNKRLKDYLNSQ